MARALIANEQGGPLAALRVSPDQPAIQRTMAAVVVHTAATLFSRQGVELLHPLVAMLTKPADLTVSHTLCAGLDREVVIRNSLVAIH